jgi:hypothetical protein
MQAKNNTQILEHQPFNPSAWVLLESVLFGDARLRNDGMLRKAD